MQTSNRVTQGLLAIIALLLGVLAVQTLDLAPSATAQNQPQNQMMDFGIAVQQPSLIALDTTITDGVKEVLVVDSAKCFLVRYNNRIEVYKINVYSGDPSESVVRRR